MYSDLNWLAVELAECGKFPANYYYLEYAIQGKPENGLVRGFWLSEQAAWLLAGLM